MRSFVKRLAILVGILLGLLLLSVAQGRSSVERHPLYLQAGTFDPVVDGEPAQFSTRSTTAPDVTPYYIVQFTGPVEQAWVAQLERLGASVLGYLPENAHVVRIPPGDLAKVRAMYAVRWVGPYRPAYKLATAFSTRTTLQGVGRQDVVVVAHPGESLATLRDLLLTAGATIQDSADLATGAVVRADLSVDALTQITANPAVSWIEPYVAPTISNAAARRVMGAESVWQNYGLFGAGQIVAVSDSGLSVQNQLSADFGGRLLKAYTPSQMKPEDAACARKTNWTDLNGHGTHVAGSVLGTGVLSGADPATHKYTTSNAGVAPEAQMVFMAMNTDGSGGIQCIPINGNYIAYGYDNGARISSNSWGSDTQGAYTQNASVIDDYIWKNQDYLVLFAAGNAGRSGRQTVGSPGSAKNIISVGASENNRPDQGSSSDNPAQMADFSSRGPTADGRTKPDIVAPGTNVLSVLAAQAIGGFTPAVAGQPYAFSSGTSMATPLTAGAAALVREWMGKVRGVANPSAALLKATMINGAAQIAATSPNMDSGWGRVDLKNTFDAKYALFEDNRRGLQTGGQTEFQIQIAGSTAQGTLLLATPPAAQTRSTTATPPVSTTISLETAPPVQGPTVFAPGNATVQTVPGYDKPPRTAPIPDAPSSGKTSPIAGPLAVPPAIQGSLKLQLTAAGDLPSINTTLRNVVMAGDFEDGSSASPGWEVFSQLWLGEGQPVRTSRAVGQIVLAGQHSIWLGGSPTDDTIYYPFSFPNQIDTTAASGIQFLLAMRDFDPGYDQFCFALTDSSGYTLNAGDGPMIGCADQQAQSVSTVGVTFSQRQRAFLAGKEGYLVFLTAGDGEVPHLSAFIDNVVLQIDFPTPTLSATPPAGPPGSTFLLTGSYNIPYFPVQICSAACASSDLIDTVYADARGDVEAYVSVSTQAQAGVYTVRTSDYAGRTAATQLTVVGTTPTLQVAPASGPVGTAFVINGANFAPNDSRIQVVVNGAALGTASSNASGAVQVTLRTSSNTPVGAYSVTFTDSTGRTATTQFTITEAAGDAAKLTVSPATGAPGTTFAFTGSGFTANQPVSFSLDGQSLGQVTAKTAGDLSVSLQTNSSIKPGAYTLKAVQGNHQASAQFTITGGTPPTEPAPTPSGNGIYITLVWTDPPSQVSAAKALVNNLDLQVIGPDGKPLYGNGGSVPDTLNNVETVRIERPTAGTYRILVKATSINGAYGQQPFALVGTTGQNYNASTNTVGFAGGGQTVYLPMVMQ